MEYLIRLEQGGLISSGAVDIAQGHRDPVNHGIFGLGRAAQKVTPSGQQAQEPDIEWVWDEDYKRYRYRDGA